MSGFLPNGVERQSPERRAQLQAARTGLMRAAGDREGLPGRTWRAMSIAVRQTLVMLAIDTAGDPRHLAGQAWDSFSHGDQAKLAAAARVFRDECKNAGCLL